MALKIYVRFSEVAKLAENYSKLYPEQKNNYPDFNKKVWLKNHNIKIIETR